MNSIVTIILGTSAKIWVRKLGSKFFDIEARNAVNSELLTSFATKIFGKFDAQVSSHDFCRGSFSNLLCSAADAIVKSERYSLLTSTPLESLRRREELQGHHNAKTK